MAELQVTNEQNNIQQHELPFDLILNIFNYLQQLDLKKVASVNTQFYKVTSALSKLKFRLINIEICDNFL